MVPELTVSCGVFILVVEHANRKIEKINNPIL
jgi:hypothetical protein